VLLFLLNFVKPVNKGTSHSIFLNWIKYALFRGHNSRGVDVLAFIPRESEILDKEISWRLSKALGFVLLPANCEWRKRFDILNTLGMEIPIRDFLGQGGDVVIN